MGEIPLQEQTSKTRVSEGKSPLDLVDQHLEAEAGDSLWVQG